VLYTVSKVRGAIDRRAPSFLPNPPPLMPTRCAMPPASLRRNHLPCSSLLSACSSSGFSSSCCSSTSTMASMDSSAQTIRHGGDPSAAACHPHALLLLLTLSTPAPVFLCAHRYVISFVGLNQFMTQRGYMFFIICLYVMVGGLAMNVLLCFYVANSFKNNQFDHVSARGG
jgi:hypothetical protein